MNVSEARAICADFLPVKSADSKIACRSIRGEYCALDTHFRCELVTYKTITRKPEAGLTKVSVTKLNVLDECPRKFALRYRYRVDPPGGDAEALKGGRAFAVARARIDSGLQWSVPVVHAGIERGKDDLLPLDAAKLRAVLRRYAEYRAGGTPMISPVTSENAVTLRAPGVELTGFLDALSMDGANIVEWKYTGMPDSWTPLKIARQASLYLAAVPHATHFTLALACKPRHKPKQGELMADFEERVYAELDPTKRDTFRFRTFTRDTFGIADELRRLSQQPALEAAMRQAGYPPNYASCEYCDFAIYCEPHLASGIGCENANCSHPNICAKIRAEKEKSR